MGKKSPFYRQLVLRNLLWNEGGVLLAFSNIDLALHVDDPMFDNPDSLQDTSEVNYAGYARLSLARTPANFDIDDDSAVLINDAVWPISTGSQVIIRYVSLGINNTIFYANRLRHNAEIVLNSGASPRVGRNNLIIQEI